MDSCNSAQWRHLCGEIVARLAGSSQAHFPVHSLTSVPVRAVTSFLPHDPSAVDIVLSSLHAHIHTYTHTCTHTFSPFHRCFCGKCKVKTCGHRPLQISRALLIIPQILLGSNVDTRVSLVSSLLCPSFLTPTRTRCNVTRWPLYLLYSPLQQLLPLLVMIPLPSADR